MVDNRLWIDSAVSPAHNVSKLPAIHCGVDAIDVLVLDALDAWTETPAQHGERGEVQLGVTVRVRIVFFDLQVAFVVEKAVKQESRIAVGAFDGHAVEGSVIIREETTGGFFELSFRRDGRDPSFLCAKLMSLASLPIAGPLHRLL